MDLITPSGSDGKMLRVSSKCVLFNDIEDLEVENLSCIVGHPNLSKHIDIIDPMLNAKSAKEFLREIEAVESPSLSYSNKQNYGSTRFNVRANQSKFDDDIEPFDNLEEDKDTKDESNDDFDLYQFRNVRLEQNERISLPIFDMHVPYKDVYHCKINPKERANESEKRSKSDYGECVITSEVWHSVEFENKSGHTLTTAPVLITRDNHQFICQETLSFTLKNSSVFIHLTKAPGIRVTHDEKSYTVASAKVTTIKISGRNYVKEQSDGIITVTNTIQESVRVVVKIQLHGSLSNYSTKPSVDVIQQEKTLIDEVHDIRWDIQLEPRQTKEIKYSRLFHRSA